MPPPERSARWWPPGPPWTFGSGPRVASLFGMSLALVSLVAWISLGVQIRGLIGRAGLLPLGPFIEALREAGAARWSQLPTVFLWTQSDGALVAGIAVGIALSVLAFIGVGRRLCFALIALLYLSYAAAGRVFLGFQWDNLLIESSLLAAFLPAARSSPVAHFLFRALLFKLYFESGLAKWQSPLGDWQDGSAMTYYYETAPLPTALAFYAHHLPAWWHHLESWATLVLELVVPFAIFGPRRARLGAAIALTAFQIVNAATANYGFFCYLAATLHLFLLDDGDLARWAPHLLPRARAAPVDSGSDEARAMDRLAAGAGVVAYVGISLAEAAFAFGGGGEPGVVLTAVAPLFERAEALRVVNTYHLFASITRERVEPELETLDEGNAWREAELRHKPGAPERRPDFVAPHQPRVDFQLWFHGLGYQRGQPAYLRMLLERMCEDAPAVQRLFRDDLPERPRAVRVVYWRYHFTSAAEKRATGAWWRRERVGETTPAPCPTTEPTPPSR